MTIDTDRDNAPPGGAARGSLWDARLKPAAGMLLCLLLVIIVYSTISPLELRPRLPVLVHVERFGAFGLLGLLLAIVLPKRALQAGLIIVAIAAGLEFVQLLLPDRHARLADLMVKMTGGVCGVMAGWFLERMRPKIRQVLRMFM